MRVIKRIQLNILHERTGRTLHYSEGKLLDKPAELVIWEFDSAPGYYLIHLNKDGEEITDTYHESIQDAMEQAKFEFQVNFGDWEEE